MIQTTLPLISIVMPCYNGERYLGRAIEAFFDQSYCDKRLIIVDGKSTDSSHQIIAEYIRKGFPIIWDKTPDGGISSAINIGLKHLKDGEVFGYLGADDILLPGVLNDVAHLFRIASGVDGLYFDSYSYIGENGKLIYRKCPTTEFTIKNLIRFGTIVGLQNIYLKAELVTVNLFSEANRYSMDYDLYIRLMKNKALNITYIPMPSSINIMHGNISSIYIFEGAFEALKAVASHVGYSPNLIYRFFVLWIKKIKNKMRLV